MEDGCVSPVLPTGNRRRAATEKAIQQDGSSSHAGYRRSRTRRSHLQARNSRSPRRAYSPPRHRSGSRRARSRSRLAPCGRRSREQSRSRSRTRRHCSRQPRSRSRDSIRKSLRDHRGRLRSGQLHRERELRSRSPLHRDARSTHRGSKGTETLQACTSTNPDTLNLLVQALKSIAPDTDRLSSMNNTIPEFDPASKEQTMSLWLHKVNECAIIYSWSDKQIAHFALPKLRGVAKRWYEGLSSVLFTWSEWQTKLLAAFPSDENYGQMLSDMLAKRAKFGDSLEDYFYDKIALINRCGITGKRAVECVLHGIDDRSVRLGAEAAQYEDLDKLLTYLRNARNTKLQSDKRNNPKTNLIKTTSDNNQQIMSYAQVRNKFIRCLNCKKEGHIVSQCTLPIKKCSKCNKIGHETEKCFSNSLPAEKSVNRVISGRDIGHKYFKTAFINKIAVNTFVDLGSECSMIKVSEFSKLGINKEIDTNNLPVLRGFGNSFVTTLGRINILIEIDGVGADTELFIVPDNVMHVPLMIGQSYTEQSHIKIQKTNDRLDILDINNDSEFFPTKIKLFCQDQSIISGVSIINIYTEPKFSGTLHIKGGFRNINGKTYNILAGIYHFDDQGLGQIAINSLETEQFYMKKDCLIARGHVIYEKIEHDILCVSAQPPELQSHLTPIIKSQLRYGEDLDQSTISNILTLLNEFRHCFAFSMAEIGCTSISEMTITLNNDEPVVYRPYRLAMKEKEVVREIVDELQKNNIVRPSTSPYASPVVLVKKKTGDYRLCIDYRALNKKSVKENYPMPLIEDQLDALSGNEFFTTLDLASGYYQVPIREQDKHKTAFVTPEGHFEFNRMPFGLANAPATFQRIIHQVLGSLRHREALAYLDDIIIPSVDIEQGMNRLELVLRLLTEAGLTLNLSKCVFFGRTINYLGFEISKEGIKPGSTKTEAVEHFPAPTNQHQVRQFLGLASFFRRFVQGFAVIAKPLTQLLKKNAVWVWGSEQQSAFQNLKNALIQRPILALYDVNRDTELHTDACKMGIAGILLQRDDTNKLRPVAYFSRQTSTEEQNYSSYDLETLAVVCSLQKFRVYLIGLHFKIITDCNSLRATFSKRDMLPRVARWWTLMQEFNFEIEYRAGVSMNHVDALSRNPLNICEHSVNCVSESDWIVTVQGADSEIQRIIDVLKDPNSNDTTEIKLNYKLKNGKLFRITPDGDRWVVPKGVRWQIVKKNHDDIGHFALDKTLEKIQLNYWFPSMRRFIKKYISSCLECAYAKASGGKKPGFLHPIQKICEPFDTLHLDHVGPFVRSGKGNTYILVIIDSFTRFIYLKAVKNTKSSSTVKVMQEYISIFGVPRRVISDRGTSFTSSVFKHFLLDKGIHHVLNAVATPRANGQVERYNRVILDALTAKCVQTAENKWDDHLPDVQWGINNTINKGINKTPAEALYGIRPKGHSEGRIIAAIEDGITEDHNEDGSNLHSIRNEISAFVETSQQQQKQRYDKSRCKPIKYKEGDYVRVERHVPATGGSKKLIPKFKGPYKITKVYDHDRYQIEDTPLTRTGNKKYTTVVAVDKIKPWLNFSRPHDDILSEEESE